MQDLVREANYVSITADAWTSDSMQKFVGVTLHFVRSAYLILIRFTLPLMVT